MITLNGFNEFEILIWDRCRLLIDVERNTERRGIEVFLQVVNSKRFEISLAMSLELDDCCSFPVNNLVSFQSPDDISILKPTLLITLVDRLYRMYK